MLELNEKNLDLIDQEDKIVLYFYIGGSSPCKYMSSILKIVEKNIDLNFYSISVEEYEEIANSYNVKSIPLTMVLEDGKELGRIKGIKKKNEVIEKINNM